MRDLAECPPDAAALFGSIAVEPEKWTQTPYGDEGDGFWVVGVEGHQVIWYNDIEEGFNVSAFEVRGTIPTSEYWCNIDSLRIALYKLVHGGSKTGPPEPL
jgi:hypothetical protein